MYACIHRERAPIAGDTMYVKLNDYFYVGFHALDTRRLPYNVRVYQLEKSYVLVSLLGIQEITKNYCLTKDERRLRRIVTVITLPPEIAREIRNAQSIENHQYIELHG